MDDLAGLALASAAEIVVLMVAVWLLSVAIRDASIVDTVWSLGFVVVAAVALVAGPGLIERLRANDGCNGANHAPLPRSPPWPEPPVVGQPVEGDFPE